MKLTKLSPASMAGLFLLTFGFSSLSNAEPSQLKESASKMEPKEIWSELLQRMPFPHTLPLPPEHPTPIDGTYTKFEIKESPPVPCRRCPDYAIEGGLWRLHLSKGTFRIFHRETGWKSIGTFIVSGDQVILANDPVCHEILGVYAWKLEGGRLDLKIAGDPCFVGLRAKNLTHLPWLSCQPPNREAAISDHWPKPAGCDDE